MEKKRVLIVAQEMDPYLLITDMADLVRRTAISTQDGGMEVRVLMPRFGIINERRNRLHEVVRLSGMNIIIDDEDIPLIIKVASLPGARIQVYFLDNDEYFKRKTVFNDDDEVFYDDNAERMVFFCKGVLETVKKFGWPPSIIHCHGWMTSLIPAFIKTAYAKDPVFNNSKVVYSLYEKSFDEKLHDNLMQKAMITKEIGENELAAFKSLDFLALQKGACQYADALVKGANDISYLDDVLKDQTNKSILEHPSLEDLTTKYLEFYKSLLN